jgi:chorismate mutase
MSHICTDQHHDADVTSVEEGRVALDALDASIRELVLRRREVSQQVQQLRRAAGGARIEHSRENQILAGYGDALGRSGVSLGLAVLEICRGQAPAPREQS